MNIEIKTENGKWIRADVVDNGRVTQNLYHRALVSGNSILREFQDATLYVKNNHPDLRKLRVVSLIGQDESPFGF